MAGEAGRVVRGGKAPQVEAGGAPRRRCGRKAIGRALTHFAGFVVESSSVLVPTLRSHASKQGLAGARSHLFCHSRGKAGIQGRSSVACPGSPLSRGWDSFVGSARRRCLGRLPSFAASLSIGPGGPRTPINLTLPRPWRRKAIAFWRPFHDRVSFEYISPGFRADQADAESFGGLSAPRLSADGTTLTGPLADIGVWFSAWSCSTMRRAGA